MIEIAIHFIKTSIISKHKKPLKPTVGLVWLVKHGYEPIAVESMEAAPPSTRIEIQSSKIMIFLRMYRDLRHVDIYFAAKTSRYDLSRLLPQFRF